MPDAFAATGVITEREVTVPENFADNLQVFKDYNKTADIGNSRVLFVGELGNLVSGEEDINIILAEGTYGGTGIGTYEMTGAKFGLGGNPSDPANYALPAAVAEISTVSTAIILPRTVTAMAAATYMATKEYDGDTSVPEPLEDSDIELSGVLEGDDVTPDHNGSAFNSKNVSEATHITLALGGIDADNYALRDDGFNDGFPAMITPRALAVTLTPATPTLTKTYDNSARAPATPEITAIINPGAAGEDNIVDGEAATIPFAVGDYNSKDVADANAIALLFNSSEPGESGNYVPAPNSLAASIAKRPLNITARNVTALVQPPPAELAFDIEVGENQGLAPGESASDAVTGELAYGTTTDQRTPIVRGSLAATANYEIATFTDGAHLTSSMLDFDNSGQATPEEGILLTRYLFGLRGAALTANLSTLSSANPADLAATLQARIADGTFDIDQTRGTTIHDAMLITRYMLEVRGVTLTRGLAGFTIAGEIQNSIERLLPTPTQ